MGHPVPDDKPFTPGDNCAHCDPDKTPKIINVTVHATGSCDGCYKQGVAAVWWKWLSVRDIVGSYQLEQREFWPCIWDYSEIGIFGTKGKYLIDGCGGEVVESDIEDFSITVGKLAAFVSVTVGFPIGGASVFLFDVFSNCVTVNNKTKAGVCSWTKPFSSLSVSITEM